MLQNRLFFALASKSGFGATISDAVARSSIVFCKSVSADRIVMAASRLLRAVAAFVILLSFAAGLRKSYWSGCMKAATVICQQIFSILALMIFLLKILLKSASKSSFFRSGAGVKLAKHVRPLQFVPRATRPNSCVSLARCVTSWFTPRLHRSHSSNFLSSRNWTCEVVFRVQHGRGGAGESDDHGGKCAATCGEWLERQKFRLGPLEKAEVSGTLCVATEPKLSAQNGSTSCTATVRGLAAEGSTLVWLPRAGCALLWTASESELLCFSSFAFHFELQTAECLCHLIFVFVCVVTNRTRNHDRIAYMWQKKDLSDFGCFHFLFKINFFCSGVGATISDAVARSSIVLCNSVSADRIVMAASRLRRTVAAFKFGVRRAQCEVWSVRFGVWRKKWEVWSVKCGVWSVECEVSVWSAKSAVWSVKCEVWSVKEAVRSEKCEVWSVECEVWSVKFQFGVRRAQCEVWSVRFGVWRKQWEVRSVKCGVWSLKFGVRRVQCEVWSVECEDFASSLAEKIKRLSREGHGRDRVSLNYIGHLCLGNFRRRLARVYVKILRTYHQRVTKIPTTTATQSRDHQNISK